MSQSKALVATLKRELRANGVTYAQVAKHLGLSENSIKRLFAGQKFSLLRIEEACKLIGMELSDLVQKMVEQSHRIERLTEQQERDIAGDIKLLMVAVCVINRWTFEEIIQTYRLTETECIQYLAKLDRLKIIELLPLNRIRLTVAKNFRWRSNGPIQQFFQREVQNDFFRSTFAGKGEQLAFSTGMLSRESNAVMMKKIARLAADFDDLKDEDLSLPLEQRFGTSIVIALRAWEFEKFRQFRRDDKGKEF